MSAFPVVHEPELVEIPCPYVEPRIAYQSNEPRKVNNLTLIDGKSFVSTSVAGDITPPGAPDVGFFHLDTRFLSRLELKVSGYRAVVLSSSTERNFASQIELTTGHIALRDSFDVPENTVHIRREQLLRHNLLFDYLHFENFNLTPIDVRVELTYEADFMDVFQVRGSARKRSGHYYKAVVGREWVLFFYKGLDGISRQTIVRMSPPPNGFNGTTAVWDLQLKPLVRFRIETTTTALLERDIHSIERRGPKADFGESLRERRKAFSLWERESSQFVSSHDEFNKALQTCSSDFHALLIPNGDQHIIAAGIPWFATIFGRDSLISAYQGLVLNPRLAADTLRVLARYQGDSEKADCDEAPGKILHEHRDGEMARTGEMPFGAYYGSVDATPLFIVLASEYFNWTGDEGLIEELLPSLRRALAWLDNYADPDRDGLIEYKRHTDRGLVNQGWKDSWDAIVHKDGRLAEAPIALVEVQGYVYDAKYRLSRLMRVFGDVATADRLKTEALDMIKRIDKRFWMSRYGYFAMALDKEKRQTEVITSNPGHLLFSRAVRMDRARAIVHRIMQQDMHSGWGWRTMSRDERVFNPLSYHRGSIWPHDNSLIAHGMSLYDFRGPALHTLTTLFQAAGNFRENRLPELFCGVQRRESDVPVQYPVSCSPQAWASGAFFLMLTSILGIRPNASKKELHVMNPVLPEWLDNFKVRNLRVGNSRVGLDFTRSGERTYCNVVDVEGEPLLVNVAFRK